MRTSARPGFVGPDGHLAVIAACSFHVRPGDRWASGIGQQVVAHAAGALTWSVED